MTKYINEETLRKLMYEEAFEKDSDMQKWDSGCWIRYKLFENCLEAVPAEDVVEIIHCKDCMYWMPDGANEMVCTGPMAYCNTDGAWYCASARRRETNE